MTSLVLQHPQLADETIARFAAAIGTAPAERRAGVAWWPVTTLTRDAAAALAGTLQVDAQLVAGRPRLSSFGLLVFDMDSTLITIECVDEIADYAGRKNEVAAITEAAMRGEIADYDESLRRRVALLAGLPEQTLQRVYDERLRLTPGAETLIAAARRAGLKVLLVSGGFTFFTSRLQVRLGLDFVRANELGMAGGRLTGEVAGEIVNADVKRTTVEATCARLGLAASRAIVVGDGANDLKMMSVAGMSVAFRAKPVVRARTTHAINHVGLDGILNFFDPATAP